jgi:hypothetical protein
MRSRHAISILVVAALVGAACSGDAAPNSTPESAVTTTPPSPPTSRVAELPDPEAIMPGIAFLEVNDFSEFRTHEPGNTFTVNVTLDLAGPVFARWVGPTGVPLSPQLIIQPGESHDLTSPSTEPGWYGLEFTAPPGVILRDRIADEALILGFAIASPVVEQSPPDTDAAYGLVHADVLDPITPTWIKTLTSQTTGPEWFSQELNHRRSLGHEELPIVVGGAWESRNEVPLSDIQRSTLREELTALLAQRDAALAWELGIEENLNVDWGTDQFWDNLTVKARIAREVADASPTNVRLVYQLATVDPADIEQFLNSSAARYFDVLSLHPYAWPDFPPPAVWLTALIADTKQLMTHSGLDLDLWFTEMGAPVNAAPDGDFFGYPASGDSVDGLTPAQTADFLAQAYALALASGVEKVFWYNYRDAGPERDMAESNFGLVDFWGYPKPAYAAFSTSARMLEFARPISMEQRDTVSIATFENDGLVVRAMWSTVSVPIDLTEYDELSRIVDQYGADQPLATSIEVTPEVVYVVSSQ